MGILGNNSLRTSESAEDRLAETDKPSVAKKRIRQSRHGIGGILMAGALSILPACDGVELGGIKPSVSTPIGTPTPVPTPSPTPTPTNPPDSPSPSETPGTVTPSPSVTPTTEPDSPTPSDTETPKPTGTPFDTPTESPTPNGSPTPTQEPTVSPTPPPTPVLDGDGDGFSEGEGDCDDSDPDINPGKQELPYNGTDDDCRGGDLKDVDSDGYDAEEAGGDDCDDTSGNTYPDASEIGDGQDNDCDGAVDEDLDVTDDDSDGFSEEQGDCDDSDPERSPGASEICDSVDNDCNGTINDGVGDTFYDDADGDSYGGITTTQACEKPQGYATRGGDCDDTKAAVNPGAPEICDNIDNNCEGGVDEGVTSTFYPDKDGDTFGNSSEPIEACRASAGQVSQGGDLNDADNTIYPGAPELCDGKDNNGNGQVDENPVDPETFYVDNDRDGFGNAAVSQQACSAPIGFVTNSTDCNDTNAEIINAEDASCDGDTDGFIDESAGGNDCDDTQTLEQGTPDCPWVTGNYDNCIGVLLAKPEFQNMDGVYEVNPDGLGDLPVYCDMTRNGGGWTLVGKIYAGDYRTLSDEEYESLIFNVSENVNPDQLLNSDFPNEGIMAFYNKDLTDALPSDGPLTLRVDIQNNPQDADNNGTFFQQTSQNPPLWDALRNSFIWGDGTWYEDYYVGGYGDVVVLCKVGGETECYDTDTGLVIHDSAGDLTFGCWEFTTFTIAGYTFDTCRHGGFVAQAYKESASYQYSWTLNPTRDTWKNEHKITPAQAILWVH